MSAGDEARFAVRLTPRAAVDRIDGVVDGTLQVRVSAPPVEDAANAALIRLLARTLGVAPGRVHLIRGRRGRDKVVEVEGLDAAGLRARWRGLGV
ncbi:MAG: DUF167 domain-containing protein [Chloroflexi bacterium]|nr:DUF167 domain-containing protein [Chloroflexota bacterium]